MSRARRGRVQGSRWCCELLREDNIRHILDRYGFAGERGARAEVAKALKRNRP
jgi:hypothetical protein